MSNIDALRDRDDKPIMRILNLGAGVQSSVVLLMSCRGDLDRLDCAIFADTQWEPPDVYAHLEWLESVAAVAGIPIHRVSAGNLKVAATTGVRPIDLPLYTLYPDGRKGHTGSRECTDKFKVRPIHKKIRDLVGLKRGQRWSSSPVPIEQWFGISADEAKRVRTPRHIGLTNRYPLVYELGMSRADCITWAATHYPERMFPRSACIACPFHNDDEWLRIKSQPDVWAEAVANDKAIRVRGTRKAKAFLHSSCKPLEEIEFVPSKPGDKTLPLFRHECMGMCGV